jgi:hypothetical protein
MTAEAWLPEELSWGNLDHWWHTSRYGGWDEFEAPAGKSSLADGVTFGGLSSGGGNRRHFARAQSALHFFF